MVSLWGGDGMKQKLIIVHEDQIIKKMNDWMCGCDADELSRFVGNIFGGKCYFLNGRYHFYPNKNYMGAFDEQEKNDGKQ
jgi:hypothetical protein